MLYNWQLLDSKCHSRFSSLTGLYCETAILEVCNNSMDIYLFLLVPKQPISGDVFSFTNSSLLRWEKQNKTNNI